MLWLLVAFFPFFFFCTCSIAWNLGRKRGSGPSLSEEFFFFFLVFDNGFGKEDVHDLMCIDGLFDTLDVQYQMVVVVVHGQ